MNHWEQWLYPSPVGWGLELYIVILPYTIRSYYPIYWGILNDSHNSWGFSQFLVHHDRPIIHLLLVWGGAKLEITERFTETLRLVSKDHGNPWKSWKKQRVPQHKSMNVEHHNLSIHPRKSMEIMHKLWCSTVVHPLSRCFMVFHGVSLAASRYLAEVCFPIGLALVFTDWLFWCIPQENPKAAGHAMNSPVVFCCFLPLRWRRTLRTHSAFGTLHRSASAVLRSGGATEMRHPGT